MDSAQEQKIREKIGTFTDSYEEDIDVEAIISQIKHDSFSGITQDQIEKSMILSTRSMIERDPAYSKVAARMLLERMYSEVKTSLSENISRGISDGLLDPRMAEFDLGVLESSLVYSRDDLFEYMGLEILSSRYCMSDPYTNKLLETPQMFWMRIAMGLALNEKPEDRNLKAIEFYDVMSRFYYTPGGRTLFQAGFNRAQMANCFINTIPDDLSAIFKSFGDNAQYLKWSGGTGTDWTPLRATGALIKGTGVGSQGVIPFMKIANDVNIAINRSGKRRGAGCIYLETWHLDIEEFLELRKNTGDERRRAHDTNTANWIPDLFMKRVRDNGSWTLFSPEETPDLHDLYGIAFDDAYVAYEEKARNGGVKLFKTIQAVDLWKKMIGMLFETGHPWITFKDPFNVRNQQDHDGVIHSTNLCTEIGLNTSADETAVCTLGSINFAKLVIDGKFDKDLTGDIVRTAVRMLDNVIDLNYYPTEDARRGSTRHRPVGLGIRGYHDALYQAGINFESDEAVKFASDTMETVAYYTILSSSELAKERGVYSTYPGSKWDRGIFPQDTIELLENARREKINVAKDMGELDWSVVREHVKTYGMRNSNTMAIAPTASTANLVGCIPCVEPIFKNIYVKSNKEGEFTIVNKYLVQDLKKLGMWNGPMLLELKKNDGSIQNIESIPAEIRAKYKEVFEIDQLWLIKAAAARGVWIDQSQSLNIFYSGSSGKELSDIYFAAWEAGLKSTYYLRTLGASQVEKATVNAVSHTRKSAEIAEVSEAVEATGEKKEEECESCSA